MDALVSFNHFFPLRIVATSNRRHYHQFITSVYYVMCGQHLFRETVFT